MKIGYPPMFLKRECNLSCQEKNYLHSLLSNVMDSLETIYSQKKCKQQFTYIYIHVLIYLHVYVYMYIIIVIKDKELGEFGRV